MWCLRAGARRAAPSMVQAAAVSGVPSAHVHTLAVAATSSAVQFSALLVQRELRRLTGHTMPYTLYWECDLIYETSYTLIGGLAGVHPPPHCASLV